MVDKTITEIRPYFLFFFSEKRMRRTSTNKLLFFFFNCSYDYFLIDLIAFRVQLKKLKWELVIVVLKRLEIDVWLFFFLLLWWIWCEMSLYSSTFDSSYLKKNALTSRTWIEIWEQPERDEEWKKWRILECPSFYYENNRFYIFSIKKKIYLIRQSDLTRALRIIEINKKS